MSLAYMTAPEGLLQPVFEGVLQPVLLPCIAEALLSMRHWVTHVPVQYMPCHET